VPPLSLRPVNAAVYSVHGPDGAQVGILKRIGAAWKFKAIGFDAAGQLVPGGGPYTARPNPTLAAPDAAALGAALDPPA
jgi:hypothetical protein